MRPPLFLLPLLWAVPLAAQPQPLAPSPSPVNVRTLDALFDQEARVEVNLGGALLRMAAASTRRSEPETAALMDGLRTVAVRIYSRADGPPDLVDRLAGFGRQMETGGWSTLVRVRERDRESGGSEDVWIYVRELGDRFGGLVVMASNSDDDEVVFVLIDGDIDPAQVGRLTERFGGIGADGTRRRDRDRDDRDEEARP